MRDQCFLLPVCFTKPSAKSQQISLRRTAALGDCIAATVVADRLIEQGIEVTFCAHAPFIPVLKLHSGIKHFLEGPIHCDITLDNAYEKDPRRRTHSFTELFIERANQQLVKFGVQLSPKNGRPRLRLPPDLAQPAIRFFKEHPKPWVIINPRAYKQWYGRHVPTGIWQEAARQINGTCFWLGQDPGPSGMVDLHCREMTQLAPLISHADLIITPDTGPLHIAAALGKQVLGILQSSSPALHLSDQVDFDMVAPPLNCLNCQQNVCPINATVPPCQHIDPGLIATAANQKLRRITSEDVSCVIPIWKPTAERVNRCLEAVLPQVSEVVITVDASGVVPYGINFSSKAKLVKARLGKIGVGPNMNHGARHTYGKYLLLLNDDMVLKPDAVAKMMECMKPEVGMVGHLMYYPNGQIYHGGKIRDPGAFGWRHVDHLKFRPTITSPHETENVTGTSILVRRDAFFAVDGFDERFFFYNEDDDLCMKFRQAGYKIIYTPHAVGVHEEGQTTKLFSERNQIMMESGKLFAKKWMNYFMENKGSGLGRF